MGVRKRNLAAFFLSSFYLDPPQLLSGAISVRIDPLPVRTDCYSAAAANIEPTRRVPTAVFRSERAGENTFAR
jgi:hypothetical protein